MKKCDILIKDCSILTPEYNFLRNKSIVIDKSIILEIGAYSELKDKYDAKDIISGKGKLAIPGLIDGHTHTSQQLLRGKITGEYPVIYLRFNLPYESKLNESDVELCTQLSCLEMIKSGTTSFADAGGTHMHKVVEAVDKSGLRAALTIATSDKGEQLPEDMKTSTKEAVINTERFYQQYHGLGDGRINVWFQFRSVTTCTGELIRQVAEKAREYKTGLHTHLSEYPESSLYTLNNFNKREVEYLDSLNVLGPNFLAAHSILLSDSDIHLLKDNDVKIVHCPRSNLGKGFTKTPQMIGLGLSIGLGTDGTAHAGLSMFNEIIAFRHSQIAQWGVPYGDSNVMSSKKLIEMATLGSAKAMLLDQIIGTIEVNKKADIVLIDIDQPHIVPTHNLLNTLTEAVTAKDVNDVIVNGKIVMVDREVKTLDEEKLMFESKKRIQHIGQINGWDNNMVFGDC